MAIHVAPTSRRSPSPRRRDHMARHTSERPQPAPFRSAFGPIRATIVVNGLNEEAGRTARSCEAATRRARLSARDRTRRRGPGSRDRSFVRATRDRPSPSLPDIPVRPVHYVQSIRSSGIATCERADLVTRDIDASLVGPISQVREIEQQSLRVFPGQVPGVEGAGAHSVSPMILRDPLAELFASRLRVPRASSASASLRFDAGEVTTRTGDLIPKVVTRKGDAIPRMSDYAPPLVHAAAPRSTVLRVHRFAAPRARAKTPGEGGARAPPSPCPSSSSAARRRREPRLR